MPKEEEAEGVNFSEYEDIKPGEKEDTEVVEVKEGVQTDFRTDNYWEKVEDTKENIEKMKEQPAIEVKTENGASLVINMPASKKVNPKSNLGLWKATYGDYPKVLGLAVSCIVNRLADRANCLPASA